MAADLTVRAQAGDTVDAVVHRALGRTSGAVEIVLSANPGIAASAVLAEGAPILIPAAAQSAPTADYIDLWT